MRPDIIADCWYRPQDEALRAIASEGVLRYWRCHKRGPAYYKLNRGKTGRIVYRGADLLAWLEARRVEPARA